MRVHTNGAELFYDVLASGPTTLIVVHGGLGFDHTYLRPGLDDLAESARLVYTDLRGNGRSTWGMQPQDVTHQTWVADLEVLRTQVDAERVVLLGHSYGGFLALEYALRYPSRTAGLILSNTAAHVGFEGAMMSALQARQPPDRVQRILEVMAQDPKDDEEFREGLRVALPSYFARDDADRCNALLDRMKVSHEAARQSMGRCIAGYDVRARLGELRAPALVISGRHDWVTPPEVAGAPLAGGLPNARHVVFEESGHFPFVEEPERFRQVVGGWLEEVAGQG
jgi:proline iminopeptidase